MKRAVLIAAVAALCVAGPAVAQDRSGGLIGSGTRAEDSGQMMGSGGFTMTPHDQVMGSGGRTGDGGQILGSGGLIGSGTRAEDSGQIPGGGNAAGQMLGSGGFTMTTHDVFMGSGGRAGDGGQILGSGRGGYFGSGLSVRELRLLDGSSLLVVSSDEGMFVIPIEE